MNYTKDIIGISLILSIDNYGNVKWYVDAEFVVHKYIISHTGGFMTMVKGWAYVQSSFKKLKTNSSTKSKFVVEDNFLT